MKARTIGTAATTDLNKIPQQGLSPLRVVVIGSGPVGVQFAQELLKRGFGGSIQLFGDEPWRPYNRIQLSSLLAGDITFDDVIYPEIRSDTKRLHFLNRRVTLLDVDSKLVVDDRGLSHPYDYVVFATGSRPWLPSVEGIKSPGVYVFRDLNDAQKLIARTVRTRHTVVVGGGLLGVEAARAMQRNNTQVTLVHQSDRLMNRQLDIQAGTILKRTLEGYGIEVVLNSGVKRVVAGHQVEAIELRNGQLIPCDTVIFSTGIQPNVELARQAGVRVGRGIVVNDDLATNQTDVFAVGECAEHDGQIYGLLAPGLEQAAILADRLCGGQAHYRGSLTATQLKILDLPIFTAGWVSDEYENLIDETIAYTEDSGEYRKLYLKRGRLKGVVAVGRAEEKNRLQQALSNEQRLYPWQLKRFKQEGKLWPQEEAQHVKEWPKAAVVCNCRGVTKGELVAAQLGGCQSVTELAEATGASNVCGSCKPLLADLVGAPFEPEPVLAAGKPLLVVVLLCLILGGLALALPVPDPALEFHKISWLERFWNDSLLKQITGFTLLGLSVLATLLALRKRITAISFGTFPWWRFIHTALGLIALLTLYLHTGFSLGDHLNKYLMTDFVLLAVVGALAGLVVAAERYVQVGYTSKRLRQWFTHAHIILFWPLPVLLGFHVLSVYFF